MSKQGKTKQFLKEEARKGHCYYCVRATFERLIKFLPEFADEARDIYKKEFKQDLYDD